MEPFIEKYRFNYIKKRVFEVSSAITSSLDKNVVIASRAHNQDKIYGVFSQLSDEQKELLSIDRIIDTVSADQFLKKLEPFVLGISIPTNDSVARLFKKHKKIRIPDSFSEDVKRVYLGWIDGGTRKLMMIYEIDRKPFGMACRLPQVKSSSVNVCSLCHHIGSDEEVAFVSPVCKTEHLGPDAYKSIGFYLCLDSDACNERITSIDKLEDLFRKVNNII